MIPPSSPAEYIEANLPIYTAVCGQPNITLPINAICTSILISMLPLIVAIHTYSRNILHFYTRILLLWIFIKNQKHDEEAIMTIPICRI